MIINGLGNTNTIGKFPGIYMIVNDASGRAYIGSSVHLRTRVVAHARALRVNRHPNIHLQRAWNTYGQDAFSFWFLEKCEKEKLISREQEYIDKYADSYGWEILYNIDPTAGSQLGYKHSDEAKALMSEANKRRSPEFKEMFSKVNIGRTPWNKGIPMREESKSKMIAAKVGMKASEETKKRLSLARKGKPTGRIVSEETRKKMALAKLGKKWPADRRAKMSESVKRNWKNGVFANRKARKHDTGNTPN